MDNIVVGSTKVRVMRKEEQSGGREQIKEIHRGVVMSRTNSFVRVFNPSAKDKGGDISAEVSELFPIAGKRCWCENLGEMNQPLAIPAALR